MSDFIISLADVMRAEIDSLNSIAQNNANVNTNGYKSARSSATYEGFLDKLQSTSENNSTTKVNVKQGSISITDRNLDFAISGSGWFGVQFDGETYLTRNGNFQLSSDGILTTASGHPVLSANGGPITLTSQSVVLEDGGMLISSAGEQHKLGVFQPNDSLEPMGNSLYASSSISMSNASHKIHQGALEESNVDPSSDMVRMMEVTRHIESMQRAINTYNELLGTGIKEIGK